jgi:hypothetical protein
VSDAIFARVLFTLDDRRAISATIVGNAGDAPGYLLEVYFTRSNVEVVETTIVNTLLTEVKARTRWVPTSKGQSQDLEGTEEVPRQQKRPPREPQVAVLRSRYK